MRVRSYINRCWKISIPYKELFAFFLHKNLCTWLMLIALVSMMSKTFLFFNQTFSLSFLFISTISNRNSFIHTCRVIDVLDQLDNRVERLRKEALNLSEKRDVLLMSMDIIKNNETLNGLDECKCHNYTRKQHNWTNFCISFEQMN